MPGCEHPTKTTSPCGRPEHERELAQLERARGAGDGGDDAPRPAPPRSGVSTRTKCAPGQTVELRQLGGHDAAKVAHPRRQRRVRAG